MEINQNLSRKNIHFWIYYIGLCLFVFALSTTRFLLTLSLVIVTLNWLVEGNFREKYRVFLSHKPAWAFVGIFALSLIGIVWSDDQLFSLASIQHKLPTLLLPIVIITSPLLNTKQIRGLLITFIAGVIAVTIAGVVVRIMENPINFREASPFIPATNFSMLLIIAAFQAPLLTRQLSINKNWFYLSLGISVWLVFFLVFLRSFSGIATFSAVMIYCFILILFRTRSLILKVSFAVVSLCIVTYGIWLLTYMYGITHTEVETDLKSLPAYTKNGNPYYHDTTQILRENGHLAYIYICDTELEEEWIKRSELDYNGLDRNNEPLKYTLYRYMASKGLTRDKEGFEHLSERDIVAVEDGYTNYLYLNWPGIYSRTHVLMMGFYMYNNSPENDPTWSTLTERFELWKASLVAFKDRPVLGWGTGRIETAVEYGLAKNNSLVEDKYIRSHNQYLSFILLWGIVGAAIFYSLYLFFILKSRVYKTFMFNIFVIVLATNGLVNDPIEGQIGQNLFAFMSVFYFFYYPMLKTKNSFLY